MKTVSFLENLFKAGIVKAALMISGTTIGAGMLGIPLVTGEIGFLAGGLVTLLVWAYMYLTGVALMKVSVSLKEKGGFLQMAERYLPFFGKGLTAFLFVFLYGILLVAYISAGSEILALNINGAFIVKLLFPLMLFSILSLRANKVIAIISTLTIPMWLYFVLFLGFGASHVHAERLFHGVYSKGYLAIPLLFGAFGYHNVVPSVCKYLKYDTSKIKGAIFLGSLIPCLVYLLWQMLILGMVDPNTLALAKEKGVPAVALLGELFKDSPFGNAGEMFAFFAIITSALGVGLSVVQFIDTKQKYQTIAAVVAIPAAIAFINPGIFLSALSFAGGFGESLLNGLLPLWMYGVYKASKGELTKKVKIGIFSLLMIAAFVVFIELYSHV